MMPDTAKPGLELLIQWAYAYPSIESITEIRNEIMQMPLSPEVRDSIEQLFVWLAAGAYLPVSSLVLTGAEDACRNR